MIPTSANRAANFVSVLWGIKNSMLEVAINCIIILMFTKTRPLGIYILLEGLNIAIMNF
jgi:hypothetical protein